MEKAVRAFLSIDIDDSALITRIAHVQQRLDRRAAKLKIVEPENIHFTLRFLGDTPIDRIERIRERLTAVDVSPFTIRLAGVGAFPSIRRPRVIWVGVTENEDLMIDLKNRIDDALGMLSYPPDKKFRAHATIARVRSVYDREQVISNLESLEDESIGTMVVTEFRMKKSTLTQKGPIYETLWQVPDNT